MECNGYQTPESVEIEVEVGPFEIEAVITCVNYADFLAETLPTNRNLFDRLIVVTSPEDKDTRRLCEYWNVECALTDKFRSRWGEFHKGAGINVGLAHLSKRDWVVQLDADIVLPPLTRGLLECAGLDRSMIYGIDRHAVVGSENWRRQMALPELQHENDAYVHTAAFPLTPRFATSHYGGYVPIGFFQLWNPQATGVESYPEDHTDAARSDVLFATRWGRDKRAFIPEVVGYHLESEVAEQGANWNGRTTKRWGA